MFAAKTLTGDFPIGFRLLNSPWQKDLDEVAAWADSHSFAAIDLPPDRIGEIGKLAGQNLRTGSIDLTDWPGFQALLSPDKARRARAVETARRNIETGAAAGARLFFTLMVPENPALPRAENFKYLLESYSAVARSLTEFDAKLVVEGWPGPGALCCTPETYRAFFRELNSPTLGVNYDPSHLLRMGIDPLRFLAEFATQVFHVHGKDTELDSDRLYEFGHEQPATFVEPVPFGGMSWRYTIPGHGQTRWSAVLRTLVETGYRGLVSIELEDARFNGTESGEKLGLIKAREFLEGC
jgi:sugar phosphate isomerase/epimerase